LDLSIVIPALDEGTNLRALLPELREVLTGLGVVAEILVVTEKDHEQTREAAEVNHATLVVQSAQGYGNALLSGLDQSRGRYVLTMDADLAHPPTAIQDLWDGRSLAEVHIASRYVPGGRAAMSPVRHALSRILNRTFSRGLDLPIADLSSGVRLYDALVLREQRPTARDFDILQEIVVRAYANGWRVREVPFSYEPGRRAASPSRLLRVGLAYLRTFWTLWKLRNSIMAADYDSRAHDSRIPLQRYWQRERHRHVLDLIAGEGAVLDVGCGSSRIIGDLPGGSVAMDVLIRKLRYARRFGRPVVQGSGFAIPFDDESFSCVLCSQVIEHVPKDSGILDELCRVLKRGGRLVLGTPDYANWQWVWIEKLYGIVNPGGYADEHIAHYTREELIRTMAGRGLFMEAERYILRGELIQAFRKPDAELRSSSPI
jgi:SAM-dependent methyltransferase